MDGQGFDHLARAIAVGRGSRRSLLKTLGGGLAAGVLAGMGRGDVTVARPLPKKPKKCNPACIKKGGTCCADGTCAFGVCCPEERPCGGGCINAAECCPDIERTCADGTCVAADACCPEEKSCGGGCINADDCCPYTERTCGDDTCVAVDACCPDIEVACDVGLNRCCNTLAGEECSYFDGCCNTLVNTICNGHCVDTTMDAANCGGCGQVCTTGQACSDGHCTGGQCSDFNTGCEVWEVCQSGTCVARCPQGSEDSVHNGTFYACQDAEGSIYCGCNGCNYCDYSTGTTACCVDGCQHVSTTCHLEGHG